MANIFGRFSLKSEKATYSTTSGVLAEPFSRSCASDSNGIPAFELILRLLVDGDDLSSTKRNTNRIQCSPIFLKLRSKTISYSIPMKCLARSDAGPHRESDAIASLTSKASLVVSIDLVGGLPTSLE